MFLFVDQRRIRCCLLAVVVVLVGCFGDFGAAAEEPSSDGPADFVVAGYLPHYRLANWSDERLGPVTDLIFYGIVPPADGRLGPEPIDKDVLGKLKSIKRARACRLLLCVGGGGRSARFAQLATDAANRQRFAAAIVDYCHDHGFDGIDYDWEFPDGPQQLAAYVELLSATRRAGQPHNLLVTVALSGWQDLGRAGYAAVDRVHLMAYDHAFPQATFAKSKQDVQRLLGRGCPAEKLVLGMPFYGRDRRRDARTYRELVAGRRADPTLDEIRGYAFNGRNTVQAKVDYAVRSNLKGIMIWELGQDSPDSSSSLLSAIAERLKHHAPQSKKTRP